MLVMVLRVGVGNLVMLEGVGGGGQWIGVGWRTGEGSSLNGLGCCRVY